MATDYKVLLFAGTVEGHKIAEYLAKKNIPSLACVATEYGKKLLPDNIDVLTGRLSRDEMVKLMQKHSFTLCVDATHPYADKVSKNISDAARNSQLSLCRIVRPQTEPEYGLLFKSIGEITQYLSYTGGNIFVTTGSKELPAFSALRDRVFARVLPDAEVIKKCNDAGFFGKHLICMQGPFSAELNAALMREVDAEFLVTKESGGAGGFDEKIKAAKEVGAQALILARPTEETGINFDEVFEMIEKII